MKTYILKEIINEGTPSSIVDNKFVFNGSPEDFLRGVKSKTGCAAYYVEMWENGQRYYFRDLNSFKKEFIKELGIYN